MSTDRDEDTWQLEVEVANQKLEDEWRLEKLGTRAQRQNAEEADNAERPEAPDAAGY